MAVELPSEQAGELDRIMRRAEQQGRLPGVVAALATEGVVRWRIGLGDVATQYRIGSITKTFTAVLVMRLRDEGRLDLADSISSHLPDGPYGNLSVRSLLSHSAGVSAEPVGPWWERTAGVTWPELAAANSNRARVFEPGCRFHYSNLAFAVLGELVARHRGATWSEVVQAELLAPLALRQTSYLPGEGAARGTSRDPRDGRLFAEPMHDAAAMAPAGQLWSTLDDLSRWADFLVTGHPAILTAASLAEMRTVQSADPDEQHVGAYGLGLRLRWTPRGTLAGHTGSMPGFLAALFVEPASRMSAVVLTNATTGIEPESLAATMLATADSAPHVEAAVGERAAVSPQSVALDLEGDWHWGNVPMTLVATPEGFALESERSTRHFERVGADVYRGLDGYFAGEELHVVRRPDGGVSHLDVVTFIFTRVPYDPAAPIPGGVPSALSSPG